MRQSETLIADGVCDDVPGSSGYPVTGPGGIPDYLAQYPPGYPAAAFASLAAAAAAGQHSASSSLVDHHQVSSANSLPGAAGDGKMSVTLSIGLVVTRPYSMSLLSQLSLSSFRGW